MKIFLQIFFLFILSISNSIAQKQILFDKSYVENYLFKTKYNTNQIGNEILNELSIGNQINVNSIEYTISFNVRSRIYLISSNELELEVAFNNFMINGIKSKYKGFDVKNFLYPEILNTTLQFTKNGIVQNFEEKNLRFSSDREVVVSRKIAAMHVPNDEIFLAPYSTYFEFTQNDKSRFFSQTAIINDYYQTDLKLNNANQILNRINLNDLDNILMFDSQLENIEILLSEIQNKQFDKYLDLEQNDFIQLKSKFRLISQKVVATRMALNKIMQTLDALYYNRALGFLMNGNTQAAESFLQKSVQVNPMFSPSHYQLAKIDFNRGQVDAAAQKLKLMLLNTNPDRETRNQSLTLLADISGYFQNKANKILISDPFEAHALLLRSYDLCMSATGLVCTESLLNDFKTAKIGILQFHLKKATKNLSNNNIPEAERRLNDARIFKNNNIEFLRDNTDDNKVEVLIKQKIYESELSKGKNLINSNPKQALEILEAAEKLQMKYMFEPDAQMESLIKTAAKNWFIEKIAKAQYFVSLNDLKMARVLAGEINNSVFEYNLQEDEKLKTDFKALKDKIFDKECQNAQSKYDEHIKNASKLIEDKKFYTAEQAYLAAKKVTEDNKQCQISDKSATDALENYTPAIVYQKLLKETLELSRGLNYEGATKRYLEAEKHFYQFDVEKYGLQHLTLDKYVVDYGSAEYITWTLRYYTSLKNYDVAMDMLRLIAQSDFKKKMYKETAKKLARDLAQIEYEKDKTVKPETLVKPYTKNIKKLKFWNKEFIKTFEKWQKLEEKK